MLVFKFGGASVQDASAIKNVGTIIGRYPGEKILIVISAMGKMTNALENIVEAYCFGKGNPFELLQIVKEFHLQILHELFEDPGHPVYTDLNNHLVEIEWILEDEKGKPYNFIYDQIVSMGELISTKIVNSFLNESGFDSKWIDVRDCIKTNDHYREAKVDWQKTCDACIAVIRPEFEKRNVVVTQGFIGCTDENNTTTLGREGSDFSASVLAYALDASEVIIWKDVDGILNADPKYFSDVRLLRQVGYRDAIELSFYGAKVLHPKTIKPLENKKIPLFVKPFAKPDQPGTLINDEYHPEFMVPSYIFRSNQILISIATRDFSFIAEDHLSQIFGVFAEHRIKIRLMQNSAISFSLSCDNDRFKIPLLLEALQKNYQVLFNEMLELYTVRYYNDEIVEKLSAGREILLEQISRNTIQLLMREK